MAVALAADSAATIGDKIYSSANKLFTLSKYHPIGIMIYGGAELMGLPWETIIKQYRNTLGNKNHDSLYLYAEDLIKFLNGNKEMFPNTEQQKYFRDSVETLFSEVRNGI